MCNWKLESWVEGADQPKEVQQRVFKEQDIWKVQVGAGYTVKQLFFPMAGSKAATISVPVAAVDR